MAGHPCLQLGVTTFRAEESKATQNITEEAEMTSGTPLSAKSEVHA